MAERVCVSCNGILNTECLKQMRGICLGGSCQSIGCYLARRCPRRGRGSSQRNSRQNFWNHARVMLGEDLQISCMSATTTSTRGGPLVRVRDAGWVRGREQELLGVTALKKMTRSSTVSICSTLHIIEIWWQDSRETTLRFAGILTVSSYCNLSHS